MEMFIDTIIGITVYLPESIIDGDSVSKCDESGDDKDEGDVEEVHCLGCIQLLNSTTLLSNFGSGRIYSGQTLQ